MQCRLSSHGSTQNAGLAEASGVLPVESWRALRGHAHADIRGAFGQSGYAVDLGKRDGRDAPRVRRAVHVDGSGAEGVARLVNSRLARRGCVEALRRDGGFDSGIDASR